MEEHKNAIEKDDVKYITILMALLLKDKEGCSIIQLNCANDIDREVVEWLKIVAKKQQDFFTDIFPWDKISEYCKKDKKNVNIFISLKVLTSSVFICGWLTSMTDNDGDVYISEITTRGASDKTIKGIGKSLINAVDDTIKSGKRIYLEPLESAIKFYEKLKFKTNDSYMMERYK